MPNHPPHPWSAIQDPCFSKLGTPFIQLCPPTPLNNTSIIHYQEKLAGELGLPELDAQQLADLGAGADYPHLAPWAANYSGHQFGGYTAQLGDGRTITVSEHRAPDGSAWECQLKGSGPTPYSRRADGRAVLRSSIREYLASEAMYALGIPSTRALLLSHSSSSPVFRETTETAATVLRAAPCFVRFGTFERLYYTQQYAETHKLADWLLAEHFTACQNTQQPYLGLLQTIIQRSATLVAHWQSVGFCHGVLNTDNMSILGLTLDYGPYGWLDETNLTHICNHSDSEGRYAYQEQPEIVHWNLYCLAQAMLPLMEVEVAKAALNQYWDLYTQQFTANMRNKLGLRCPQAEDAALIQQLFSAMHSSGVDFTRFFRALSHLDDEKSKQAVLNETKQHASIQAWLAQYQLRLGLETQDTASRHHQMQACNPKYILRNHLVEEAIQALRDKGDKRAFERLFNALQHPFAEQVEYEDLAAAAPNWAKKLEISCSS